MKPMVFELSVVPVGVGAHVAEEFTDVRKVLEASGLEFHMGPAGPIIEGDWDSVMPVFRLCHERVTKKSPNVITLIRIDNTRDRRERPAESAAPAANENLSLRSV